MFALGDQPGFVYDIEFFIYPRKGVPHRGFLHARLYRNRFDGRAAQEAPEVDDFHLGQIEGAQGELRFRVLEVDYPGIAEGEDQEYQEERTEHEGYDDEGVVKVGGNSDEDLAEIIIGHIDEYLELPLRFEIAQAMEEYFGTDEEAEAEKGNAWIGHRQGSKHEKNYRLKPIEPRILAGEEEPRSGVEEDYRIDEHQWIGGIPAITEKDDGEGEEKIRREETSKNKACFSEEVWGSIFGILMSDHFGSFRSGHGSIQTVFR
jgi:hypothetical protein